MRLTLRSNGAAATHRTTGLAVAALLLAGLLVPFSLSAGAQPASAVQVPGTSASTAAEDAVTAAASAEDLLGDITFSVPSGTFQSQVSVSLGTAISGAEIRYTTDGKLPTAQSTLYQGTPLRFTRTTQLRAQSFVGGTASGKPGTAMYGAIATTTAHDLPVVMIDSYGAGKPAREYFDSTTMIFQPPTGGTTSLAAAPAVATRAGFKLRGQSSASFEKAPYRLEFHDNDNDDADYPVLGMPADSDWVLRGPFTDKSLIREAFVYDLGREMGLKAPRYSFAEFYLNTDANPVGASDYMGVYMIVETIKNTKNRLDLKKLDEEDTTLPKISGGYIWKFEWMAAEEPTLPCTGAANTCWNYLEVADPSPLQPAQKEWLRGYIQEFNNVLRAPNSADPATGYQKYIDVDSFIDHMIVNELSRGMDAYVRSAHFYKDRDSKIFAGPLWDFDLTFGVGGYFQNDQAAGWQYQQTRSPQSNDWYAQLMRDPAFVNKLKARWQSLRGGLLSNASLTSRADALARPLTNAAQRNFQRWPNLSTQYIGPFITPTASTWQGQVQYMKDWMTRRTAWLDSTSGWGGGTTPTTTTTTTTTTTPPPAGARCTATYAVTNKWQGGYQVEVKVTAGSSAIGNWTVAWNLPSGEAITQSWNATVTTQGSAVTARNASHNGSVAAGASTTFGFLGSTAGTPGTPTPTCTGS
ncbi:CotH kinase family protein [Umezawaea sp. Da 62-37]|uniref:CotH kinase family protein n=1 Tax=Umezawaea sp. Da 62-37 TaxID=3075927 RepID=UPI0028F734D4|nr:CotH kinase family protein [Umezawaea sp. Da 62-37]WNV85877.1 CotH kinase family protein [Umezawaea sp. Da 62-37]